MKYEIPTGPPTPEEIEQTRRFCEAAPAVSVGYTPPDEMPPLTDFQRRAIEQAEAEYAPATGSRT